MGCACLKRVLWTAPSGGGPLGIDPALAQPDPRLPARPDAVQATHIFDGLESWPSHVMYVAGGQLQVFEAAANIPELRQGQLLSLVERWLREEQRQRQAAAAAKPEGGKEGGEALELASWNNGWAAGRLASSIKHASNAVMRM